MRTREMTILAVLALAACTSSRANNLEAAKADASSRDIAITRREAQQTSTGPAMPVLDVGRGPHDVAFLDLLHRASPLLDATGARRHDQDLADRM